MTDIDVMMDLETLGKVPGSKILSIGAVVFSARGLGPEFYIEINRDYQSTLTEDPDTLAWWAKQAPEVRDRLLAPSPSKPYLSSALFDYNEWLESLARQSLEGPGNLLMWGNGAAFDNALMNVAIARSSGPKIPAWSYRNDRCYRTLKSLRPDIPFVPFGTHHNALDDAKGQALHAVELMKALGVWV